MIRRMKEEIWPMVISKTMAELVTQHGEYFIYLMKSRCGLLVP